MASTTFDLTAAAGVAPESSTVLIGTGEIGRVRFTEFSGGAKAYLKVTRNAVTSRLQISSNGNKTPDELDDQSLFIAPVVAGDTISVVADLSDGGRLTGIVEGV